MNFGELDTALFLFVNKTLHIKALDPVMAFITSKAYVLVLPVLILMLLKDKKKALPALIVSVSAVLLSDWISNILKHVFERPRPFMVLDGINPIAGRGGSYSMPSGHASNAFAFVVPYYLLGRNRLKHIFLATAVLVAFSRVYIGVHYPSDVAAGALVGSAVSGGAALFYIWASKKERHTAFLILFLTAVGIFRIYYILSGPIDLSPDEAHYWEWSRRPDISYYSKGPIIAYLIWLGTAIFGDTVFGIRAMAPVLLLLSSILLYKLGSSLYDKSVGMSAAFLLQIVPLFSSYGVVMTIDSPLVFFWCMSLFLFQRAVSAEGVYNWLLLGVAVGLGFLSKYTMVFFYLSVLLFLTTSKEHRKHLLKPAPYIALISSIFVSSPVIIWNKMHGWVTFRHTLGQSSLGKGFSLSLNSFFEFLGSQAGVVTPVLFVLIIYSLIKLRRGDSFSFWFSMPVLVFFFLKSIQGKVQANWAMTGYITGFMAFSALFLKDFERSKTAKKILAASALFMSLSVTALAHYPVLFKIPQEIDPTARLRGWKELGLKVTALKANVKEPLFIFSDTYQASSELAFYVEGKPVTYCVNMGRRMNQYDLWPGFENLIRYNAVFVKIGDSDMPEALKKAFMSYEKHLFTAYDRNGERLRDYSIFLCHDFKGMKAREIVSY